MTPKPRKGDLREVKCKKIPRAACPHTPLETWVFGRHTFRKLVNIYPRSVPALRPGTKLNESYADERNNRFCLFTLHLSHVKNGVWIRKRGISTYDYFLTEIIIKAYASVNSSCAQTPPSPSLGWLPGISIFFALDGKFPGLGTLELSNPLGWGWKNPPSTQQHFSLIAQSRSAILSILMWNFLFQ